MSSNLRYAPHLHSMDGHSPGKQTYHFTPNDNRHYYSEAFKTQAVTMYVAGMCVLDIGRTPGVKMETIYSWLKNHP